MKIISDTQGALYDDNSKFIVYKSVEKAFKSLKIDQIFNYSSLGGNEDFTKTAMQWILKENSNYFNNKYDLKIITETGSGSCLNDVIYANNKYTTLIPDIAWHNYYSICKTCNCKSAEFKLLDNKYQFNIKSFKEAITNILSKQDGIQIIINDPIQNPTGISISKPIWKQICKFLNAFKNKNINLIIDPAYIDYLNVPEKESRQIFDCIKDLNSNINIFICFSFSKTLAIYGTRIAALIVLSNNSTKLQESILNNIKGKIFRTPTLGALIVTALFSNKTLLAQYKKELSGVKLMLKKRAELFMTEANSCKLDYIPYTSGFFITVPVNDPEKIISSMKEYSSVLRPQGKSLRVGICGMPLNTIKGIAKKIKSNI